jgi:hypothetical protein
MSTAFRTLTALERSSVLKLIRREPARTTLSETRSRTITVRFDHTDNFTVAILKIGKAVFTGVAKRNPRDKANAEAGEAIALRRAIVTNFPPPPSEDGE